MNTLLFIPELFGVSIEVYFILLLLGASTFFFWRWLFKKYVKVDRTRKIATWSATILLTPMIYIGITMLWVFSINYYPSHAFDRQKWFADKEKRYELSKDIIETKMLIGKTKDEVRLILGDDGGTDEQDYWSYYLGFRPQLFGIDPDVLDIEFKHGKVIKVGQHET